MTSNILYIIIITILLLSVLVLIGILLFADFNTKNLFNTLLYQCTIEQDDYKTLIQTMKTDSINDKYNNSIKLLAISYLLDESNTTTVPNDIVALLPDKFTIEKIYYLKFRKSVFVRFFIVTINDTKYIYIAYRGTKTKEEFDLDQKFKLENYSEIITEIGDKAKCHKGFTTIYNEIRDDFLKTLETIKNEYPNISNMVTIGHSLGAGINILSIPDIESKFNNDSNFNLETYTIGGPRICNEEFSIYLSNLQNININRFVNNSDYFITIIPPFSIADKGETPDLYYDIGTTTIKNSNDGCINNNHSINTYYELFKK